MPAGPNSGPPFLSELIAGVIGGVTGAFFRPPIEAWWKRRAARREAARFFSRIFERLESALTAVTPYLEKPSDDEKTQTVGWHRLATAVAAPLKHFYTARERLLELNDDGN